MTRRIRIHSFADVDRSGKVRWTAEELGYEIEEQRVRPGQHRGAAFRNLNPFGLVPAVDLAGERLAESGAICRILAQRHPEAGLIPDPGPDRDRFEYWSAVACESLEYPLVSFYLAGRGLGDARLVDALKDTILDRLDVVLSRLPGGDFLVPGHFTLADVFMCYVLRVGVNAGLLPYERVATYLGPLRSRPAAARARFFDSLPAVR